MSIKLRDAVEPGDAGAPPREERIFSELVRALYASGQTSPVANAVLALLLAGLASSFAPPFALYAWLSAVLLLALARAVVLRFYRRGSFNHLSSYHQANIFIGLSFGSAILWGSVPFVMDWNPGAPEQIAIPILLAGIGAGGVAVNSALVNAALLFFLPILLPITLLYFSYGMAFAMLGMAVVVFCAFLSFTTVYLHRIIRSNIVLSIDKETLLQRVGIVVKSLEESNRELRAARTSAEKANAAKSEFLARMSHEFRTPLNGILGMAELALSSVTSPEEKDALETIHQCGQSLLALVNEILDLARIESGKVSLQRKPFDPGEDARKTFRILEPLARAKSLSFEILVHPDLPQSVIGDSLRVRQVLTNLAGNAIKFTPEGGAVWISVFPIRDGTFPSALRYSVRDTGGGIPSEVQERIFESFVQGENASFTALGSTGLGLAICAQLTSLMGGSIDFESSTNGTLFEVTIPFDSQAKEHQAPLETARKGLLQSSTKSTTLAPAMRILLVEDNKINQQLAKKILESAGHEVTICANGKRALELGDGELSAFDVILMDCEMPVVNGFQAASEIRRRETSGAHKVPIVAVTSYGNLQSHVARCKNAGMDEILPKPLNKHKLLSVVERYRPKS